MRQYQSYVIAFEICHAHDSKKQKHFKREQEQSHPQRVHKDKPQSRRDKGYPPRHQGSPFEVGPPRSRHIYVMEEEPRAKNLRDGGENPRFNRYIRDIFYAIQEELPAPPPKLRHQIVVTITYGVIIIGNAESLNVFCIKWSKKGN